MIDPREWYWTKDADGAFYGIGISMMLGIMPAALIGGGLFDLGLVGAVAAWSIGIGLFLLTPIVTILAFAFSFYRGITHYEAGQHATRYLSLPKRDREEFFPPNYLDMLRKWKDLEYQDVRRLDILSSDIHHEIAARNAIVAKAALTERQAGFGTGDFLEELERRKAYAKVEADTYKELM